MDRVIWCGIVLYAYLKNIIYRLSKHTRKATTHIHTTRTKILKNR